jgi:Ca-activated chloride channel family protein
MPLRFENPLALLFIAACVPIVWGWYRYFHSPGVPRLLRTVTYIRAAALLCIIAALAGMHWMTRQSGVDLLFLTDISESVTPAKQAQGLAFIRTVAEQLGKADRAGLIAFGSEAYVDQPLGADLSKLHRIESAPSRSETNLQAALELALSQAEANRNMRVILVGDGLSTRGDAESLIAQFSARGIPIDAFNLISPPAGEVSLEQAYAPLQVREHQPFSIQVVMSATFPTQVDLLLIRNGAPVASATVKLEIGQNVFTFSGLQESAGVSSYEVRLQAADDTYPQNNVAYATVSVAGPSRVLLVSDDYAASEGLYRALLSQNLYVDLTNTAGLPANAVTLSSYGTLVLHDVSALKLSQTQQAALAAYVRNLGGGLVVLGGYNSYGLGGYYQTPLEEIMPVTMDIPDHLIMPSIALVLVMDKSGSMAGTQGRFSKINLAKEAALGVLDVMTDRDLFGFLAFDSEHRWIVPVQSVTERVLMAQQIASLTADGGTDMGPALLEAYEVLSNTPAMVKHAVVLSDGQSVDYDFAFVTAKLRGIGVTVSTVAIGADSDRILMERIAAWGGGRSYYTDDIRTIPQIFTTEALMVSRPLAVEGRFQPQLMQPAPFLTGINQQQTPPLDGYILTTPKATAAVHLGSEEGHALLASWRHGLGRVVAFTSSTTAKWASAWLNWPEFAAFWSQTIRWTTRPEAAQNLQPYFDIHDGMGNLVVDAVDENGEFINFLNLTADVVSPSGQRRVVRLIQTAPGQYQAAFPIDEQGAWLAAIADTGDSRYEQPVLIGATLPYSAEYRLSGIDGGALERLTRQTGGVLFSGEQIPPPRELSALWRHPSPVRTGRSLVTPLLVMAFFLFFLDICIRYLPDGALQQVEKRLRTKYPILNRWFKPEQQPEPTVMPEEDFTSDDTTDASEINPTQKAPRKPILRLDQLIAQQRAAETQHSTRYDFSKVDPAKAAARYLAQRRQARAKARQEAGQEHDRDA